MSALITVRDKPAVALWPSNLARVEEAGYDLRVREGWRHMPEGYDTLFDWIQVVPATDPDAKSGEKRIIYACRERPPGNLSVDVTVLVHGFVHSLNLAPLGNWNGREQAMASAAQYLTLVSGRQEAAFAPQLAALANIRELLHTLSGAQEIVREHKVEDSIRLKRNVFVRVRGEEGAEGLARVDLTDEDDPGRRARKLASRCIRAGDFVEVTVAPEIYQVRQDGRMKATLHFVMRKVAKIRSAQDAKKILEKSVASGSGSGDVGVAVTGGSLGEPMES